MLDIVVEEIKYVAVVGLMEYQAEVQGVDAWYVNIEEVDEKFEFLIEKQEEGILISTPDWNGGKGILSTIGEGDELSLLQGLIDVISKEESIGIHWYDVVNTLPAEVQYFSLQTTMDEWRTDVEEWLNKIADMNCNCLVLVHGNVSLADVSEMINVIAADITEDVVVSVVCDKFYGNKVRVSLWA